MASKLEPYKDIILDLRLKGKTFPEISPYYLVISEILLSNYKASMYDLGSGIIKNM